MFAENVQWPDLYVKNAMNYELKIFIFCFCNRNAQHTILFNYNKFNLCFYFLPNIHISYIQA